MVAAWRAVGLILLGVALGWVLGRGNPRPMSEPAATAPVAEPAPQEVNQAERPTPDSPAPPPQKCEPSMVSLEQHLSRMKISELRQQCDDAEKKFLKKVIDAYAPSLDDLPANVRDQELAELARRFITVADTELFWRMEFSLESGRDVLNFEILLDLESNSSAGSQCAAWSVFYEINGRTKSDSLMGASACNGNGYRKKANHYYVDLALYGIPSLGRHVTSVLLPLPGAGVVAEYLPASSESWQPLAQAGWIRSSRMDFLNRHKKYQQRLEAADEDR